MTPIEQFMSDYASVWYEVGEDPEDFVWTLADQGVISWDDAAFYIQQYYYVLPAAPPRPPTIYPPGEIPIPQIPLEVTLSQLTPAQRKVIMEGVLFEREKDYFERAFHNVLVSLWKWMLENVKELFLTIKNWTVEQIGNIGAFVRDTFTPIAENIYRQIRDIFEGHSPIEPEDAPALAASLFAFATGTGMLAHSLACAGEAWHPYKALGLQYGAGFLGELAGWGRISNATLGIYMSRVIAQLMTYYVQARSRPRLPDEFMLQQMVFEGVLDEAEFRKTLAYYGYSDTWIDKYLPTMRPDPRYFELSMMIEDETATDPWIQNRVFELGYEDDVNPIMVKGLIKKATRTQRNDFYRQAFNLYKEGYISKEAFDEMLGELEYRPEALHFAGRAAELAYLLDHTKDMVSYYVDSYLKDIIDEDELLVSLVGLGITSDRAWLLTAKAKVRKRPKATKPVAKPAEKATYNLQKEYTTLYITQYRKDLIDESQLYESLLSIGLESDLAEVTVAIEAAKRGLEVGFL